MFTFPVGAVSDVVRHNIESQFSFLLNISKSVINTSMQLGELNVQASRKLMEESTTALKKGMEIRTLADAQMFIAEQSQLTVERVRGYGANVQNIAAENWSALGKIGGIAKSIVEPIATPTAPTPHAETGATLETAGVHAGVTPHGAHETEPHASPLVEKLVASVSVDPDKLH